MATITKADLIGDVTKLLQMGTADYLRFGLDSIINLAQRHIVNTLPAELLTNVLREWRGHLLQNEDAYVYPSDLLRVMRMNVDYSAEISETNIGVEASIQDGRGQKSVSNLFKVGTSDYPIVTLGAEGGWTISPVPTADQNYGWMMYGVRVLPEISDSQNCLLNSRLRNLMTFYSAKLACGVNNYRPERIATYEKDYDDELQRLMPKTVPAREVT